MERLRLKVRVVDHAEALRMPLPDPWPKLLSNEFHPDLYLRAAAFKLWCLEREDRHGPSDIVELSRRFLTTVGEGFVRKFDRSKFTPKADDPYRDLKVRSLDAVEELSETFGNRLPALLWDTLAFIAVRENPTQDRSIIPEVRKQTVLPFHYTELDACLHALGKVYALNFHVAGVFYRHTEHVITHGCDCGCDLYSLAKSSTGIDFRMPREEFQKATQSFMSHLMSEYPLLAYLKLPFELGVGEDAAAAIVLEREGL